jgi:hypothetical protein
MSDAESFDEHCTPLAERLDAADTGYVPRPAEDERLRERAGIHRSGRDGAAGRTICGGPVSPGCPGPPQRAQFVAFL